MPGSIRVSVLESVNLPTEATEGRYVSIKVNVGKREYQTKPSKADGDKTTAWNSDFTFPVLNLRDNLVVSLLDSKGNSISETDIGTTIIIEKGFWDDLFPLKGGGHVHLRLNFLLTAEERKKIEAMREAALNRKELGILKKRVAIQVLGPVAENRSSASISSTGITQANPEDGKSKDGSHNKENQISTLVVPHVSQLNEVQKKTEIIEEAPGESSTAFISSPIKRVIIKKESSNDAKGISGNNTQNHGFQDPPQYDLEGAAISVSSKELIPSGASISSTGIAQATPGDVKNKDGSPNKENQLEILLVPEASQSNAVQVKTETMKEVSEMSSTASICLPIEHVTNEKASIQYVKGTYDNNIKREGFQDLPQHNLGGPIPVLSKEHTRSKESYFLSSQFPSPENQTEGNMCENTLISYENLQATLSPHVKDDFAESQISQIDNLIHKHPMIESAQTEVEETRSLLPETVIVSKISSSQALAAIHQAGEINVPGSPLQQESSTSTSTQTFFGSCPPSESLHIQGSANLVPEFTTKGNTELLPQDIFPVENNRIDYPYRVLPLDAGSDSLTGWPAEGLHEGYSLKTVPNQPNSVSVMNSTVDTASPVSTCFASLPASQIMKGNSTQSSVKAKIKAFESNIYQDSDNHSSPQAKSSHKTEIERARQRLQAEAAAAEAAEAMRRAEEEELKSKRIAKGRERKPDFQEKMEESMHRSSAKVKRKCLEKNEEDEREIQENIKDITVVEKDKRRHESYRREGEIQKVDEKKLELGERNRWMENMTALRRPMQEQGEKPLRAIETKDKTTKNDPEVNTLIWERMRLGESQLKRNSRDKSVKSDLSGNNNEEGEKLRVNASTMDLYTRTASEQRQNLEALTGKSQLLRDKAMSVAETSLITAEKRKTEGDQRIRIGNDIIAANQKLKLRQGGEHDLIIKQRVKLIAPENSFAEDTQTEEGSAISEEELEDLANSSKAIGGFIKQALGAVTLLAAGALFMWAREEKMSSRRDHLTPSKDEHNFLQKNEESSRNLRGQIQKPNSRNSKPSSKVMDIEEITHIDDPSREISIRNENGDCRIDNLVNQLQNESQEYASNKGPSLTKAHISVPMSCDSNIDPDAHGLRLQEVEDLVSPSQIISIYDGHVTSGEELQISLFTHPKMQYLASLIYKDIYGMEPTNEKVPMYFAKQLYAHLVMGYQVDFRSIPEGVQISKCDQGILDQIFHIDNNDYGCMPNPKHVFIPHDIEQRVHHLNEEKNHIESIVQRERQHLQTFVHAFCVISERARQDINMEKSGLNGVINTKKDLERSLKSIELQLKHAYLDTLDMLEAQRARCVAQVDDAMQQLRATSTWILELQGRIKDHREQALQILMLVREMEQRGRLLQQEIDMLSRGTQSDPYKVSYSRFLFFPYLGGALKLQNLEPISYVDIHKPCCCVCLSTLQQDGFYGLQCGHLYHFSCFLIHIIGQNKCVTCKDEISLETYLNIGMEDFIPNIQILDEVGLPLDCTPKKYL